MTLTEILESKTEALKVAEVAHLLGVTQQHIYKMAARQLIPSFSVGHAVRFDPHELADWIRRKKPQLIQTSAKGRRTA